MNIKFLLILAFCLMTNAMNVSAQTSVAGEECFLEYCIKYTVPNSVAPQLKKLLLHREADKIRASETSSSILERVKSKMAIDSVYQDSINLLLIPYNSISGENLAYALRLSNTGFCTKKQTQKLQDKALVFARSLARNPGINIWNEEMDFLQKVFKKKQLEVFFELKNLELINNDLRTAWNKLQVANLDIELDSVVDCSQAYVYYVKKNMIENLYKYQNELRVNNLDELRKHRPYMLRLLEGLESKKRMNGVSVSSEFIW